MTDDKPVYFNPKFLEVLKQNLKMSPETWHKITNPTCGACVVERVERSQDDHKRQVTPGNGQ